jgi:hypothetical protein
MTGGFVNKFMEPAPLNTGVENKHQAVSQGDYGLEAGRLGRYEAEKRHERFCFKLPSLPAFYLRTYNAFTKAAQRRITA